MIKYNKKSFRRNALRLLIPALFLLIAFIPTYFVFKQVDANLLGAISSGDGTAISNEIKKYNNLWGVFLIVIIHVLHDLFIFIPSAPIHMAAGIILGKLYGFLVCHICDVCTNMAVFILYKMLKDRMDTFLPLDEKKSKTVRFISEGHNKVFLVIIASIMPAVPNGFVPYAAVLAGLTTRQFFIAALIGPAAPTAVMTFMGEFIIDGNWPWLIVLVVFSFTSFMVLYKLRNHFFNFFDKVKNRFSKSDEDSTSPFLDEENLPCEGEDDSSLLQEEPITPPPKSESFSETDAQTLLKK